MSETMSPRRHEIFKHGRKGQGLVRVVEGSHRGALVFWTEYPKDGKRATAIFPRTREGKVSALAFAQGVIEEAAKPAPVRDAVTVEGLFTAFREDQFDHLRPNTRRIYQQTWAEFQNLSGPHTLAADCTRADCVKLRRHLESRALAINTMRRVFVTTRRVFRWGEDAGLIPPSSILRYVFQVGKDRRPVAPPEYRLEEFVAIIAACPLAGRRWRSGAILRLCGYQGIRQHAALHLAWEDVDWDGDELVWRAAWDKMGREWRQPMRKPTRAVLEFLHAQAGKPEAGWVFPAPRGHGAVYTIQSLWAGLRSAETAAGVERKKGRAGHGLRRMLAGDVAQLTGNVKEALDAIGDTDVRQAERYLQPRRDKMRATFDRMDAPETAYESRTEKTSE
jgi:integrase